ncbi:MAG: DUF2141 domain-containing protein [Pseudomonadota bacterium]
MFKSALIAIVAAAGAWSAAGAAYAGDVHVHLDKVEHRAGKVLATLQNQTQFLQGRGDYSVALDPPTATGALDFTFAHVAPGDYVLSVMHDEDGDFQMKKAANGMPQEGWAFSNGGMLSGPPTFDVLKFTVGASDVTVATEMYYPYVPPAAAQ